jgi:hypothetical protein
MLDNNLSSPCEWGAMVCNNIIVNAMNTAILAAVLIY